MNMMRTRVIPVLLIKGRSLYKTVSFKDPVYVGDPINTVKIFNDKEVDELIILDIAASNGGKGPDLGFLREFSEECFIPLCYGGGIDSVARAESILRVGVEKVSVNTAAILRPQLVKEIADAVGSQSIVGSMDIKRTLLGNTKVARTDFGIKTTGMDPAIWARKLVDLGAGEILVNSIDMDGTGRGYELEIVKEVSHAVNVPVIASGGAGKLEDFRLAVDAGAAAVAAGQMFVFHGRHRAVLINYPSQIALDEVFNA